MLAWVLPGRRRAARCLVARLFYRFTVKGAVMVAMAGGQCRIIMRDGMLLPGMTMPVLGPPPPDQHPNPAVQRLRDAWNLNIIASDGVFDLRRPMKASREARAHVLVDYYEASRSVAGVGWHSGRRRSCSRERRVNVLGSRHHEAQGADAGRDPRVAAGPDRQREVDPRERPDRARV